MCAIGKSGRHFDWYSQNESFLKPAWSRNPVLHVWMAARVMPRPFTSASALRCTSGSVKFGF